MRIDHQTDPIPTFSSRRGSDPSGPLSSNLSSPNFSSPNFSSPNFSSPNLSSSGRSSQSLSSPNILAPRHHEVSFPQAFPFQGVEILGCDARETAAIVQYLQEDPTLNHVACLDPKSRPWYHFGERAAIKDVRLGIIKENGRFLLAVARCQNNHALRQLAREVDIAYAEDIASLFHALSLTFLAMENTVAYVFGQVSHIQASTCQQLQSNKALLELYREHSMASLKNFLGVHENLLSGLKHSLLLDSRQDKENYNFIEQSQERLLEIYEDENE